MRPPPLTACDAIISLMLCSYCSARMASLRVCSSFKALSTALCSALGLQHVFAAQLSLAPVVVLDLVVQLRLVLQEDQVHAQLLQDLQLPVLQLLHGLVVAAPGRMEEEAGLHNHVVTLHGDFALEGAAVPVVEDPLLGQELRLLLGLGVLHVLLVLGQALLLLLLGKVVSSFFCCAAICCWNFFSSVSAVFIWDNGDELLALEPVLVHLGLQLVLQGDELLLVLPPHALVARHLLAQLALLLMLLDLLGHLWRTRSEELGVYRGSSFYLVVYVNNNMKNSVDVS
ncbi:hypothetical protein EYF80_054602 [Liparis tanakae]|uniref:Uncharacterized protein n=1 Tax=Liparis tanakae TaxID=230148 RepID=A0A4Z2F1Y9_9TELE|nr:hypothetical protein EYF80_054602 [Liparis tanakae]